MPKGFIKNAKEEAIWKRAWDSAKKKGWSDEKAGRYATGAVKHYRLNKKKSSRRPQKRTRNKRRRK